MFSFTRHHIKNFTVKHVSTKLIPSVAYNKSNTLLSAKNNFFSRPFSSAQNVIALIEAVKQKNSDAIDRIARQAPKILKEQTSNDNTALHEAAKAGDVEMIMKLSTAFSKNFNVNHKCHCYKRRTPLAYAVENGHLDAVNTLLTLGADPDITDENGWTALDYALSGIKSGSKRDYAISGNNSNNVFEKIGITLLEHQATAKKFPEGAKVLLKEININKKANYFFEEYKVSARERIQVVQKTFLEGRKAITPGKL
ncbi:MAG: ankyrin repeat domain-containing protein [Gammaproteobacteria bacterium]|nr:ankyrin repeat domain-containing protein [Gammaproteobacteria bacterium]